LFGDGLINVTEVVDEGLELGAVVGDGEIEDGTLQLIVVTEVVDDCPEGERICLLRLADDAQNLRWLGHVDPIDNAAVDLVPISITVDDGSGGGDKRFEANLVRADPKNIGQSV
jgi:hypothetical protein